MRPAEAGMGRLLDSISGPADLKRLDPGQLPALAAELRAFIYDTVNAVGGHLSSNLGAVELAIALHYVFSSPTDRIIWDVGHQAYPHKVLTGRRKQLATVRRLNGLAGFPVRSESEHDAFGTAHASTSISAALGMAAAGLGGRVIAVIGDGALSGGMAFEGLNNAGSRPDLDLLVVVNDNDMSISPAVGAMRQHLARVLASKFYRTVRDESGRLMPGPMRELAGRAEEHIKGMFMPGTLFEEMGFTYAGPVDGHDLPALVGIMGDLRDAPGPQLLHTVTVKGKGYAQAERDPVKHHGVSPPKPAAAAPVKIETKAAAPTYSQIFGQWLCAAAERDRRVVGITPAMREGSGMVEFAGRFPDRYFDVGIAEQHAMTFAAGLACCDQRPVLAIYSTFLQRAYDQLIHDVAIQRLPVLLAIDRAGLVGADGATHHGAFDLSFLRCIPNLLIMAPASEREMWLMLNRALAHDGPAAVRYPRGQGTGEPLPEDRSERLPDLRGRLLRQGNELAIIAFGSMVAPAVAAGERLDATVADARIVKPLDIELMRELAAGHRAILTVEENVVAGGAGSGVAEALAGSRPAIAHIGLPDRFIEHGSPGELLAEAGLTADRIVEQGRKLLAGSRKE